ncbi:DNA replication licensing factor [Nesidiocoris tenuis]|uniref:DNA helicase MCM8 n=1 Tax=Nesidiocoris tenuis TaxID=355587 RepID=A0ABN7ABL7_9HEMI|nr:DNA replication licensing factor [Nesidiocoris tenuis]
MSSGPPPKRGGRGRGRGFQPWFKKPIVPSFGEEDIDYGNISLNETLGLSNIPYKGWYRYFPDEEYNAVSPIVIKTRAAVSFFEKIKSSLSLKDLDDRRYFNLDVRLALQDETFLGAWSTFENDLNEMPELTLSCLGLALHTVACTLPSIESIVDLPYLRIRIVHYDPIIPLRDIKAGLFGKLVTIRGTVIRVGPTRLLCTRMGFACTVCRKPQSMALQDGIYSQPKKCPGENCRSKNFLPLCSSPLTKTKNLQIIKVQESLGDGDSKNDGGRVPRSVEVEFTEDLVDSCSPGDTVTITGIVKINNDEGKKKNGANLFTLFLEGNSVVNTKGSSGRLANNVGFSMKDYYAIQEIHDEENIFRLLVNSICPAVYGHELVKTGILLSLFGGADQQNNNPIKKRPLIHVLIVGDPGLGKSHLLHAAAAVAPRGVYVCGNTTSSCGLTVTLTRESGGDFALEAGALVLANHGICCIDEFDKMTSQHQALLEAMEQERLSVAKGGVVCTLPAHSTIIAAANPVGGHYNRSKSVIENLRMSAPLLSRFDLVFILLDKPNEELDNLLSDHVLALHTGSKQKSHRRITHASTSNCDDTLGDSSFAQTRLIDRLRIHPGESVELVPQELMRKYIAYARKYVPAPKLSPEAGNLLQNFYLELRGNHRDKDTTPVTTRQLESMIRMTEARAKLELREVATEDDARDVIELMQSTLNDLFDDGFGGRDYRRSVNGTGSSQSSKMKRFIAGLQRRAQMENKNTFTVDEMKEVCRLLDLAVPDFFSFISIINMQGFLLKKSASVYQLVTV